MLAVPCFRPEKRSDFMIDDFVEREPAIDLVHLALQTDGDLALESDLLAMFDCQAAKLVARLGQDDVGVRAKADIAHRLRGSALAIGARRVASTAQALERFYEKVGAGEAPADDLFEPLAEAVAEARAEIANLAG